MVLDSWRHTEARSQAIRDCRKALFLSDPAIDRANLTTSKGIRVAGTCEWIKENERYQQWLEGKISLLWIWGGAGKGKTMLSVFLTEELELNGPVVYYFCSSQDKGRDNASAVLRSLLWQITIRFPDLAEQLLRIFKSGETSAPDFSDTVRRLESSLTSIGTLWNTLTTLVLDPQLARLTCVLDGLDECEETSRNWLASKIYNLNANAGAIHRLRIIIVSREIQGLRQSPQLNLDRECNDKVSLDIRKFVSARVEELATKIGLNADFRREVEEQLLKRSEDTFLWVGFAMDELLRKSTGLEVEETLQDLPFGLPAYYGRMLRQINAKQQATISTILQWVTLATRPLSLKELASALEIKATRLCTKEDAVRDLISLCGPFLAIHSHALAEQDPQCRPSNNNPYPSERNHIAKNGSSVIHEETVTLIHQSARDYMSRPDSQTVPPAFRFQHEEAQFCIAWRCIDCIQRSAEQAEHDGRSQLRTSGGQQDPLLDYAMDYWTSHAQQALSWFRQLTKHPSGFFGLTSAVREQWWRSYRGRQYDLSRAELPALHIAAYVGMLPWVRMLITRDEPPKTVEARIVNTRDSEGRTALLYAVDQGREAIIQLLLKYGASTAIGERPYFEGPDTPILYFAARAGKVTVMRTLIEHGANVCSVGYEGETPLHEAARGVSCAMVELLLESGAEVKAQNNWGETPLHVAAYCGTAAVVRVLLDGGSEIEAKAFSKERTPLHIAAYSGSYAVVRTLLDYGADTAATKRCTALHRAAEYGDNTVVRLLLDRGAEIEAEDEHWRTALQVAAYFGREDIVRFLSDRGAFSDVCTALGIAVQEGYEYGGLSRPKRTWN